MRLLFLILIAVSSVSLLAKPMNVVFFLVDDMGYYDLSYTGSKVMETPNVDEFAADAASILQGYAAYPRCVPSRFAMITGVHPSRAEGEGEKLTHTTGDRVTIADALKAHGYATYFAGKWHLGHDPGKNYPDDQGFDINIGGGSAGAPGTYFAPFISEGNLSGAERIEAPEGAYLTDVLTDKTVSFIKANKDKPFFVYLSHYAVHTPIEAKKDMTDRYQKKIDGMQFEGEEFTISRWEGRTLRHQTNAEYAAMVESVDESMGRIVDVLKANGLYENTIIILTSDHGGLSNSGYKSKRELATTNLPLRAGKGHMYEGGIRVPVIVRWPGNTKPGSKLDFPMTGMDYYPTILEMLGFPAQPDDHQDGVSFVPGLKGKKGFNKDRSIFWYSDRGRENSTGDRNAAVIRNGKYKLLEFFNDNKIELYDLSKDPGELNDLSGKLPKVKAALYAELKEWKKAMKVRDREMEPRRTYQDD
ncbi:MAG: sulfatase [Puniceicoccaceae bacterium]